MVPITFIWVRLQLKIPSDGVAIWKLRFVKGKLWVINPDHDYYHQSHLDFAQVLVRPYGFYGRDLTCKRAREWKQLALGGCVRSEKRPD
jgi:hypothetical protein